MPEGLATGAPQARAQLGMEFFDYLSAHPQALDEFGAVVEAHSTVANQGVLERYDFRGIRTLVDVGAGFGRLVMQIVERYPALHGIVFDLPAVIEAAPKQLPAPSADVARSR